MNKLWFTSAELADMSLPNFPKSKRGVNEYAKTRRWEATQFKCRTRAGRGGGREFHISLLSADAQNTIALRHLKKDVLGDFNSVIQNDKPIEVQAPKAGLRRDAKLTILIQWDAFLAQSTDSVEICRFGFVTLYNSRRISVMPDWVHEVTKSISISTLKNWLAKRARGEINELAGNYGNRKGTSVLDTAYNGKVARFISARIVKQPHLNSSHIRDLVRAEFGDVWEYKVHCKSTTKAVPNLRNIQRWIKNWKEDHQEVLIRLTDPDKYKNKYQPALGKANAWVKAPNELWEIDASPADVLLKDGRYNIYLVVDIYTRRIKVLVSKTPTTAASLMLIRQAILDWGVPQTIRTDNGSDFISHQFRRALIQLGIRQDVSAPFTPEHKGTVERHIKTLQHSFMPLLPGFIGHNIADRSKIEARKAFAHRLGEEDHKAFCVDLDQSELQELVNAWCDAKYAHKAHYGLKGKTPFEMASGYTGSIRRIENKQALHLLLSEVPGKNGFRTVTKKGVRIDGFTYWGNGLQVGRRVFVRHDPDDLGRIYCFTEDEREFICTAENCEMSGIDPVLAAQAAKAEQKRRLNEEIEPLKREIKRIKPRDMIDSVLHVASQDSRNVEPFPNRSIKHITNDLTSLADALNERTEDFPASSIAVAREKKVARQSLTDHIASQEIEKGREEFSSKNARFERAIALESLLAEGAGLSSLDNKWLQRYHRGAEYKSRKRAYDFEKSNRSAV